MPSGPAAELAAAEVAADGDGVIVGNGFSCLEVDQVLAADRAVPVRAARLRAFGGDHDPGWVLAPDACVCCLAGPRVPSRALPDARASDAGRSATTEDFAINTSHVSRLRAFFNLSTMPARSLEPERQRAAARCGLRRFHELSTTKKIERVLRQHLIESGSPVVSPWKFFAAVSTGGGMSDLHSA